MPAESGGLTLDDLRHVALEAGIDPARVAHAAATLDARRRAAPVRRLLGLRIGMSRVVDLPRAPTDREWEQLIAEFRTTFGATGVATSSGGLRDWSHGDLHISVEPTEHGEQLRVVALRDDAVAFNGMAIAMGGFGALMSAVVAGAGKPEKALVVLGMFGGMAIATFAANLIRLPRWGRERERQLEAVTQHAVRLLSGSEE